jgi:methionyl-tRNA formyltransferase
MRPLKVVFAGTPAFAVPSLEVLLARQDVEVLAVYTQPDRPAGRGQALRESEVKRTARAHGLRVEQPVRMRDEEAQRGFAAIDCDLLVVTAFGQLLPAAVIDAPRLGAINVHASLLPRWRGAAPIQRALMAGDVLTGITIMRIVERLDAGPMLLRRSLDIEATDTGGSLHDKLAALGGSALTEALDLLQAGGVAETPQDESAVTYARKIERADRLIDWRRDAEELDRLVRALCPSPLAIAEIGGIPVNLFAARPVPLDHVRPPGSVIKGDDEGLLVACGRGALLVDSLQPAGKRVQTAREFLNGYRKHLGS